MNNYHDFVETFATTLRNGKQIPLGEFEKLPTAELAADAPKALIFSPHPDDEVLIGGLALRMLRKMGVRVINVAVTQGSNRERQGPRLEELKNCCDHIGFDLLTTKPETGLEKINVATRSNDPSHWRECIAAIAKILSSQKPHSIFFPHVKDWNSTHIGTYHLVMDALATLPSDFSCHTFQTEFWGAMDDPNRMIESSAEDLGDLLTALSFHVGEVQRNPYHLLAPAWMMDNVRRGAELVGGQGGDAPDFTYATLYKQGMWKDGSHQVSSENCSLGISDSVEQLFNLITF
jgi:LmbE family N-acetylglucosaminyl deacetylase